MYDVDVLAPCVLQIHILLCCRYIFYCDKVHFCKQTEEVDCCTLYNHAFHDRQYTLKKNSHSCTNQQKSLPPSLFTAANVDNVGNFTLKTFVIFPQTSAVTNISIIKSPQYIGHMFIMVQIFSDTNQTEGSKST